MTLLWPSRAPWRAGRASTARCHAPVSAWPKRFFSRFFFLLLSRVRRAPPRPASHAPPPSLTLLPSGSPPRPAPPVAPQHVRPPRPQGGRPPRPVHVVVETAPQARAARLPRRGVLHGIPQRRRARVRRRKNGRASERRERARKDARGRTREGSRERVEANERYPRSLRVLSVPPKEELKCSTECNTGVCLPAGVSRVVGGRGTCRRRSARGGL